MLETLPSSRNTSSKRERENKTDKICTPIHKDNYSHYYYYIYLDTCINFCISIYISTYVYVSPSLHSLFEILPRSRMRERERERERNASSKFVPSVVDVIKKLGVNLDLPKIKKLKKVCSEV